jgi:vancomycin resistance protein YoaR
MAGVLGLGVLASGAAYGSYASWRGQNRIAPGVSIQGVPVGGLSKKEARQRLVNRFAGAKVTLQTPERAYTLSLSEVGGRLQFDRAVLDAYWYGRARSLPSNVLAVWSARSKPKRLALPIRWDKAAMRRRAYALAEEYQQEPRDARLRFVGSGLEVLPEAAGKTINVGATLKSLQQEFRLGAAAIPVTTKPVPASVKARDLDGHDVQLGRYVTRFNPGEWGRTRNIYIAAAQVDGRVLMPGERFSFNECTGERTWEKGYRMAHIFETKPGKTQAEVVDGLAGGVCQVSTTVYNAVRKANEAMPSGVNIGIVERNYHSLPVTYVSSGMDATVAWPSKDFRFRNTLAHPIYLRTVVSGSRLIVSVWGRLPLGVSSPSEVGLLQTQTAQVPAQTARSNS